MVHQVGLELHCHKAGTDRAIVRVAASRRHALPVTECWRAAGRLKLPRSAGAESKCGHKQEEEACRLSI